MDIATLQRLLDKLIETRYKAEEILTGKSQNITTFPPITTPPSGILKKILPNSHKKRHLF